MTVNELTIPGKGGYLLAVILLVAGLALLVAGIITIVLAIEAPAHRILAPGEEQFTLDEPGAYVIAYEQRSVLNGQAYDGPAFMPMMKITLHRQPGGETVALAEPTMNYSYNIRARSGRAILAFEIDSPGTFLLTAEATGKRQPAGPVVLAVGRGFPTGRFMRSMCVLLLAIPLDLAAVIVFVITLIRRSSAKARLRQQQAAAAPPIPRPPVA